MNQDTTSVEMQKEVPGKLVVSVTSPTPMWATWVFRIVFLLTMAATLIIAGDPGIDDGLKVRIMLYLKGFDVVIWGIGRGLGIKKEDVGASTETP